MKNKTLLKILFVLILALVLVNGKYIISIADSFDPNELIEEKIYNSEDEISIDIAYEDQFGIFYKSLIAIYTDKNDNTIAVQAINAYGHKLDSYKLFKSCDKDNASCYDLLFDSTKMESIKYWEYTKSISKNEYCEMYNSEVDDKYDVVGCLKDNDNKNYFLVFKEYIEPTFELDCLPKNIKYNEKATCSLNVESTKELNEIKLTIATDLMKDLKLEVLGAWEIFTYNEETGELILKNPDGASGEYTAVNLNFVASENVDKEADVSFGKIEYKDQAGNLVSAENLNSGITISKVEEIKNPFTKDLNIVIISFILLVSSAILANKLASKNNIKRYE